MARIPLIQELMTPMPMTIGAAEVIRKAKLMMTTHSIRHLPVVDRGKLVGILSDRDIKLAQAISRQEDFDDSVRVIDVCMPQPYAVDARTPADVVLAHMYKERIGSALITDGQKLTGIFTVTDACRTFAQFLRTHCQPAEKPE